ncbi:hypothetical protein EJ110_NYTH42610 [Nymphaea thermarum]|nr:hypothetical protein EJ110_NYTH42610 [Nymphaea thermarum]
MESHTKKILALFEICSCSFLQAVDGLKSAFESPVTNCFVAVVVDTGGRLLTALGYGLWPSMVLLSEIVQTFILADFCYYYVKSANTACRGPKM